MSVRAKINMEYRGFPITVEGDFYEVGQIDFLKQVLAKLREMVDYWHLRRDIRRQRALKRIRRLWDSEQAMTVASKFLFEGEILE